MVLHRKDSKMQKKWFIQWEELISLTIQLLPQCIDKLMEITHPVNKKIETITGNSTQLITDSVSARKRFWTVQPLLSTTRDTKSNSQKPWSSKRLLKTIKPLPQTSLEPLRISVKAKWIEEQISFMASRTLLVTTLGTPLGAFMESLPSYKFSQIETSANQRSQIAEMLWERRKTSTDHSVSQLSGKMYHSKTQLKRVWQITK